MSNIFSVTLEQLLMMFLLVLIGFVMNRSGKLPEQTGRVLSVLEVYVFMPALMFGNISANLDRKVIGDKLRYLLFGVIFLAVVLALAFVLSKILTKKQDLRHILMYTFTFPNYGYIGYPLVGAVFGETVLLNFIIFALPFSIAIYSIGKYLLCDDKKGAWKRPFTPSIIAIIIGAVWGIIGLKLPGFLSLTLSRAAACMAPVAMLVTGFVLANEKLLNMFRSAQVYLISFIRLLAIPVGLGLGLQLIGAQPDLILMAVAMTAMPAGVNLIIFPEAYGGDSTIGARICFLSSLASLLTVPLLFAWISR